MPHFPAHVLLPLQDEDFYQISLDVRGKRTLAESLRSFVSKELMDGQDQYHCEELGRKVLGLDTVLG